LTSLVHVAGHVVADPLQTVFVLHCGLPAVPTETGAHVPKLPLMLHDPQFELAPVSQAELQQKPSTQ
jgi:hypothetical protein